MGTITTTEARESFADVLNRASYGHERIAIKRHGKVVAALISADDLELLEALEAARDLADYRKALAEDTGERVSLRELKSELGL